MKIVDSYVINDGGKIFSVELAEDRFVDVKVCDGKLDGLIYVVQNEDGSTVYTGEWVAGNTCPGYAYDEKAVLDLVKEAINADKDKIFTDDVLQEGGSNMVKYKAIGYFMETGIWSGGVELPPQKCPVILVDTGDRLLNEIDANENIRVLSQELNWYTIRKGELF